MKPNIILKVLSPVERLRRKHGLQLRDWKSITYWTPSRVADLQESNKTLREVRHSKQRKVA